MSAALAIKLLPSPEVKPLAAGFAELLAGHAPSSRSDGFFADGHESLWRQLDEGGWCGLGIGAGPRATGLDLRDLLEFAELWGRFIFPLPFLSTLLIERWQAGPAAEERSAGWTFAVPARGGGGLIPHGQHPGIRLLGADAELAAGPTAGRASDAFAPSVPLTVVGWVSALRPEWLAEMRACLAAEAVGAAQVALESAVSYAGLREAYGQPIGRFQAVKHRLADVKRDVELARSAAVWAAQPGESAQSANAAALAASLSQRATASSIQVFAGIGFTWELELHFYLRHILALQRLIGVAFPV